MNEDRKKYIRTKSLNAITYVLYNTMEDLDFYIDESNKQILFQIPCNSETLKYYLKYKNAVKNNDVIKVDLILYNSILRDVKFQTKEFRKNFN